MLVMTHPAPYSLSSSHVGSLLHGRELMISCKIKVHYIHVEIVPSHALYPTQTSSVSEWKPQMMSEKGMPVFLKCCLTAGDMVFIRYVW